jgi:hypothetical protein
MDQERKWAMKQDLTTHPAYESLYSVVDSMVQWIKRYRNAREAWNEFANCGPDELANITRDLRLQPAELAALIRQGPNAADLLQKLLPAVGIDAKALEQKDPATMHDLRRLCTTCVDKRRCQLDLANGRIVDSFRDYCPNAFTVDALLEAKQ